MAQVIERKEARTCRREILWLQAMYLRSNTIAEVPIMTRVQLTVNSEWKTRMR